MKIQVNGNGNGKINNNEKEGHENQRTFEQEIRRARVLGLHSRGFTQMEIAKELNVDQSTISKDLHYIKDEAKNRIIEFKDNLSFEFVECLAEIGEIKRELWKIASTEMSRLLNDVSNNVMISPSTIIAINMHNKNRIMALTQLLETIKHRMEMITGGPRSTHDRTGMTVLDHAFDVKDSMKTDKEREQDRDRMVSEELANVVALSK